MNANFDEFLREKQGKIIHQIWFGIIPNKKEAKKAYEKLELYRTSWKTKNTGWTIIEWDKKMCLELLKNFYPEHLEMFLNYKHEIQRCDAVRYLILHRYGGWYVDMDYYCNRSLDEAMAEYKNDIYFVQSPNGMFFQEEDHVSNSLMYSVPGHSFWKKLMIELELNKSLPYFYPRHLTIMFTTGPGIINRMYSRYKFAFKLKSLPAKYFHPYGIGDNITSLSKDSKIFAIHIGKGSWEKKDSKFFIAMMENWKILLFIIIVMTIGSLKWPFQ